MSLLKGIAAFGAATTSSLVFYRWNRARTIQAEKLEDPTKMNIKEKFQHFSTVGEGGGLMTTGDFVQSMVAGSGGCQSKKPQKGDGGKASDLTYKSLEEVFKKMDSNNDGVLSYQEYCMFVTLISTNKEHFRIAFKMFDMNGNGKIDIDDFKKMMDALVVDPSVKLSFKGGVCEQFFGKDYTKELTFDSFISNVDEIRREVRTAEFRSVLENPNSTSIPFNKLQLLFGLDSNSSSDGKAAAGGKSVTLAQYHNLVSVLLQSDKIQRSMEIFTAGKPDEEQGVNKRDFVRALRSADARLSAAEVDLFFDLFDFDRSGSIDSSEFSEVAKKKKSFFSAHRPRYDQPQRNAIQSWAYCMQQRE